MIRLPHKKIVLLSVILLPAAITLLFAPLFSRLSLTSVTGDIVYISPATDFFEVSFIHSVNKSPVIECYRIEGDTIWLEESYFQQFGTGMPFEADENTSFAFTEEWVILTHTGKSFDSIEYRVGTVAEHAFAAGDTAFLLKEKFPPQSAVRFEVRRYSLFTLFYSANFGS